MGDYHVGPSDYIRVFGLLFGMASDDAYSIETGLELVGIARPIRSLWMLGSSTKIRNKRDWRGSPVATPMPKSVLSGGREDQLLRE